MRLGSAMPILANRSSCSGLVTTRRAWIWPFKQRSAAAVSTPSGAPPVPITAWTPVPITAALMPAERSPSEIRRIRARAVEDDDDEVFHVAVEPLGDGFQIVRHRCIQLHRSLARWAHNYFFHV